MFRFILQDPQSYLNSDSEAKDEEDKTEVPILSVEEASEYIERLIEFSAVRRPQHFETYLRLQNTMEEADYQKIMSAKQTKLKHFFSIQRKD